MAKGNGNFRQGRPRSKSFNSKLHDRMSHELHLGGMSQRTHVTTAASTRMGTPAGGSCAFCPKFELARQPSSFRSMLDGR